MVKKGYQLVKPLIIYHTTNSKIWSKNINLRLNFELDKDSSLRLIDLFNDTSQKNFLNIFYNFELKENAVLKNYKVDKFENKNIKYSFNNIDQDKNSISETFILSSGSSFSKKVSNFMADISAISSSVSKAKETYTTTKVDIEERLQKLEVREKLITTQYTERFGNMEKSMSQFNSTKSLLENFVEAWKKQK